ncbi:MAG: hypothetical protein RR336_03625, partial [Oscillospiraceae bacterium]
SFIEGSTASLKVTPATGMQLSKLYYMQSDGQGEQVTITPPAAGTDTCSFIMPKYGVAIYATFVKQPPKQITNASTLTNGTITSAQTAAYAGETIQVTVCANPGYTIVADSVGYRLEGVGALVPLTAAAIPPPTGSGGTGSGGSGGSGGTGTGSGSGGGSSSGGSATAPVGYTFLMPDGNVTLYAEFAALPTWSITLAPATDGTIDTEKLAASCGEMVKVTLTPA